MSLLKRSWSRQEAEEWTVHDLLASLLSVASYFLVAIGVAGSLLLQVWGYVTLVIGIVCAVVMHLIIDPKLKAASSSYSERQSEYGDRIERLNRWEEDGGS
jgi:membrane protein YdbS with pleckstrin-like domain